MIDSEWEQRLKLYITAIAQNHGHKMLAINNMPDHVHVFIGLNPNQSISDCMRTIKSDSSEWINNNNLTKNKFQWQEGYGAFSHSRSQINDVVQYIAAQQDHHKKYNFLTEYKKMLINFGVDFDERYIFNLPE